MSNLEVYAIRNEEGLWLRSNGYGHYGKHWVEDVQDAKLYQRLSQARSRVSFWANYCPDLPPPVIVVFSMSQRQVLDERERVAKVKQKKAEQESVAARRQAKRDREEAERQLKDAEEKLRRLRGK